MSDSKPSKPILCLDFDGVMHSYTSGWQGADKIPDPPTPNLISFLIRANFYFAIHVYSSRSHQPGGITAMRAWLWKAIEAHYDISGHPDESYAADKLFAAIKFPASKPAAMVSIDDRALTFTGDWRDFEPQDLRNFQPWNKKQPPYHPMTSSGVTQAESLKKSPIRRFLTGLKWALSGRR